MSRNWLLILIPIILIVVGTAVTLGVLYGTGVIGGGDNSNQEICETQDCIDYGKFVRDNMDLSANPCESFYNYSCGGFMEKAEILENYGQADALTTLNIQLDIQLAELLDQPIDSNDIKPVANAKKYYLSCASVDEINQMAQAKFIQFIGNEFGGWPVLLANTYNPNRYSPIEMLTRAYLTVGAVFFYLEAELNPKDPRTRVLQLKQPIIAIDKEKFQDPDFEKEYKDYLNRVVLEFNPNARNITSQINGLYQLEKSLAEAAMSSDEMENSTEEEYTIKGLETILPKFNWQSFIIDGIFKNLAQNYDVDENEIVRVSNLPYLVKAIDIFANATLTRKRDLDNLIVWRFLTSFGIDLLPSEKRSVGGKYNIPRILKLESNDTVKITCAKNTNEVLPFVVGRMYVEKHFDQSSRDKVLEMTKNLIDEFKKMLEQVDWMDEDSRQKALDKANSITVKIGYPDYIFDDRYLDDLYPFDLDETDYLTNQFKVVIHNKREIYQKFNQLRDKDEWLSGPAVVNAFYSPLGNEITFPAGILQPPVYNPKLPDYVQYGAIGYIIGHEITHGFDNNGRLFDKDGAYFPDDGEISLWSQETIANYKEKAECMVQQYNDFNVAQIDRNVNGELTLGENIADNGGLKESYLAYKTLESKMGKEPIIKGLEKFNQDQLYFISAAQNWCAKYTDFNLMMQLYDEHSPNEFRILGPTSNSADFAKAFNCKLGMPNNPVKKCNVW